MRQSGAMPGRARVVQRPFVTAGILLSLSQSVAKEIVVSSADGIDWEMSGAPK